MSLVRVQYRPYNLFVQDYPKPDGTTTYTDLGKFFGDQGAYFDIGSESNNLFLISDLRNLLDTQRQERLDGYKEFLVKALDTIRSRSEPLSHLSASTCISSSYLMRTLT
jgi:hypothetical protein